jgi:hypothetical protein
MWVKGTPLHFIIDSGSQKSLILTEVVVGRLVVVIDVNPSHGFWTRRLMKLFGHEGK